jgi:hypothetical protein
MLSVIMLSIVTPNVIIQNGIMLSVIIQNVVMLSVIIQNVVMLNVMAPQNPQQTSIILTVFFLTDLLEDPQTSGCLCKTFYCRKANSQILDLAGSG